MKKIQITSGGDFFKSHCSIAPCFALFARSLNESVFYAVCVNNAGKHVLRGR